MKQIFIFLLAIIGVAYGQSSPTSAKTRFVNGIYLGTKLDSYFAAADSNAIYWRADSALMAKYKGTARRVVFSGELGSYIPYSDTTSLLSQVVRTFGTQTIGGNKTFSNDIFVNSARIGIGAGGNTSNSVLGYNVFTANTSGTKNTAVGENALSSNVSATDNTAFGWYSLDATTGSGNTGIGSGALGTNTSGSNNTALGFGAGEYITGTNPNSTGTNSIYIGFNTKASANGETNQTVIGHNLTGNGSNTVTIGNSSVTDNYFTGNIRGGAFIKSGGTSSQFLKADGSVDGTSYATAASISGTTNYIPKFTGSGSIGNSIAFESVGRITFESTNISPLLVNGTATNGGFLTIQKGGVDLGFFGSSESISASANKFDISARTGKGLALYTNASSTAAIDISTSNAVTLTGALSGTSLSMSGGGQFTGNVGIGGTALERFTVTGATGTTGYARFTDNTTSSLFIGNSSGVSYLHSNSNELSLGASVSNTFSPTLTVKNGDVLINTTTTDGTNKLIVNGGVKGTRVILNNSTQSQIEAWGWSKIQGASSATGELRIGGIEALQGRIVYASAGNTTMYIENTFDDANAEIKFRTRVAGTAVTPLTLTSTAATFSSSVYGQGYRFAYAAKSANYTLTDTDDYINVTASCTITLPTAVGRSGKRYVIKCIGSVTATIASTSSETIDGNAASTYTFGGPNFNIMIVYSNGANWNLEAWQTGI